MPKLNVFAVKVKKYMVLLS